MKDREQDFVSRLVQIARLVTRMDDDQAALLEDQIRQEYGGDSPYVAATNLEAAAARNRDIVSLVRSGDITAREAARRFSVSRAHVYRLLSDFCQ